MQLTGGGGNWHDCEADGGSGAFDDFEELAAFGSVVPTRGVGGTAAHDRRSSAEYFDMDIELPLDWESISGKGHKLSKSTDSQDFEFNNMSGANPVAAEAVEKEISPADDLFYKGQLLPLHLPKRLQMVQKLSSPKQTSPSSSSRDRGEHSGVTVSCFFQPSSLKYSVLGLDESCLGSALVNSRSSSFHSQGSNNFWESDSPGDVDTGDSSSSRDSSGSSQDACVPPEKQSRRAASFEDPHIASCSRSSSGSGSKDKRFFQQQREFFSNHNLRGEKSLFSSWLRSPFKWKVLFGLRRGSKAKSESAARSAKVGFGQESTSRRHCNNDILSKKKKLPREAAPPLEDFPSLNFSRPSTSSSHSDQKLPSRKESFSFSSATAAASGASEIELPHSGLLLLSPTEGEKKKEKVDSSSDRSKARESLQKYLNILKPLNGKGGQRAAADSSDVSTSYRVVDIRASTFSGNLTASPKHPSFSAGLPSPSPRASFGKKSMSSPKASFSDKKSPVMNSLSGNLRVPSFSRSSKASINATAASPRHSGILPSSSPSSMAELHSAIQGAIAHCKQSQAAKGDSKQSKVYLLL